MSAEREYRSVEHGVVVRATVDAVWKMLTTSAGLASWYGVEAEIDHRPGGAVRVGWGNWPDDEGNAADIAMVGRPGKASRGAMRAGLALHARVPVRPFLFAQLELLDLTG